MLDPEASRQTAHIFLDAAAVHHRGDTTTDDERDEMTGLALEQLAAVGSIQVLRDDETGAITLDIARAQTGILAVLVACLDGWAACSGLDRDELITQVLAIVDANLTQ